MRSATDSEAYARVHGSAGEQPRLRGLVRVALPLLGAIAAAGYLLRAAVPWPPLSTPAVGGLFLLLALWLAAAVALSQRRLNAFIKGARGEEGIARVLGRLPAAFDVYHGVTLDGAGAEAREDLDHVVVGPAGVFAIETKNWAGRVRIADGRVLIDGNAPDRPPIEQVNRAADRLRALLREACGAPVAVQPILCFLGPAGEPANATGVSGVVICRDRHLLDAIREHGETPLAPAVLARVRNALKPHVT